MKAIKTYSTALPSGLAITDTILTRIWDDAPHKPLNVEIWVRFCKWTSVSDHSQGFTELGTINLMQYLPWDYQLRIMEEVEDFRSGQFGIIRGSNLTLRFLEETRGINIGTILKQVFTQNYASSADYYTYSGQNVHLWELILKIGDERTSRWISPPFSWIYGWLFDAATETLPRFTANKGNSQTFEVAGDSLLTWMDKINASKLGDYSNKSGVYYDNSELEAGNNGYSDVMNYSTIEIVTDMCDDCGVTETERSISMPPINAATGDYSTITASLNASASHEPQPAEGLPVIEWKSIGTVDYRAWIYAYKVGYLKITMTDTSTGYSTHHTLTISSLNTNYCFVKLWHNPSNKNEIYALTKHVDIDNQDDYEIIKLTLSGTSASNFAVAETSWTLPVSATLKMFYMQADLDIAGAKLFCTRHFTGDTPVNSYVQLGYFELGTPCTWTTLQVFSQTATSYGTRIWHDDDLSSYESAVGGFRVLYSSSRNYAITFLCWIYDYNNNNEWMLVAYTYDDARGTVYEVYYYDFYITYGYFVKNLPVAYHPITGGRGTIGGFYNETDDLFVFALPGIDAVSTNVNLKKNGVTLRWTPGNSPTYESIVSGSFVSFRTFSSHGTAFINSGEGYLTGFLGTLRDTAGNDYETWLEPILLRWNPITNALVLDAASDYFKIADGKASFRTRKFPILSAPSLFQSSNGVADSVEDRSFLISKNWNATSEVDGTFLTVFSKDWYHNFNKDYSTIGGSYANELQDIMWATGSIARFDLHDTVVKPRYDDSSLSIDKILTAGNWKWNSQTMEYVGGYEVVKIDWSDTQASVYSTSGSQNSLNILDVSTDYCPTSTRAQAMADALYALHSPNRWKFKVTCFDQFRIQPLDNLSLELELSPGGRGFAAKDVMVLASEINGHHVDLTVVELGSTTGVAF